MTLDVGGPMHEFTLPYGQSTLPVTLPDTVDAVLLAPAEIEAAPDPLAAVEAALARPVGGVALADFAGARSAAVAINDDTRPVPHSYLLPPLLARLEALGLSPEAITLVIATGAHAPMPPETFARVVPPEVLARYPVISHDCDAPDLVARGATARGTPVWMHRRFVEADLRVVVGNIEPHQFAGFSGGVKSAAIGLGGRATINANHALLRDPAARLARYAGNPAREDIEEIGERAGVHFALNVALNSHKQIVKVVAGAPRAVMGAGIPLVRQLYGVPLSAPCDLVIAAPGGHPKDINLYQAQKALAHAALVVREGGSAILVAACPEGVGSRGYAAWMTPEVDSFAAVFEKFAREGFRVGPHKAYLIARDGARLRRLWLVSMLPEATARRLLFHPASLDVAVAEALSSLPPGARVGVLPYANATIPLVR